MDPLMKQMNDILAQYTSDINKDLDEVMKEEAQETKKALREKSPTQSGRYAKGWAVKHEKGRYIVYNKKPQLTHLLEKGHDIKRNGVKIGEAPAFPHISKVEEWMQDDIMKKLEKKLSEH